jgi:hypothetical protein
MAAMAGMSYTDMLKSIVKAVEHRPGFDAASKIRLVVS